MRHLREVGLALLLTGAGCHRAGATTASPGESTPNATFELPRDGEARCSPFSPGELMHCVEESRLKRDVHQLVELDRGETRSLCARRLQQYGFKVSFEHYGDGTNVVAMKPGFSKSDELIIVGAHYDRVANCPGANDNASGVAATLEVARILASARFDRTLVIACWDEGEKGQLGSAAFAQAARKKSLNVIAAVNYEAVFFQNERSESQKIPEGFEKLFPDQALRLLDNDDRADFLTIVSERSMTTMAKAVVRRGRELGLPVYRLSLSERQKSRQREHYRSDHLSFWQARYPAMLVTDSGALRNPRIHCAQGEDEPASLDFDFAVKVTGATLAAIAETLQLR